MVSSLNYMALLLSIVFSNLLLSANGQASAVSTGSSTVIGDKEYYVATDRKVNWYRATQICASQGMTLASIESSAESANLKSYLDRKDQFWLSGTDLATPNEFSWFGTGNTFRYTNWGSKQPGRSATYRCVLTDSNFQWFRASCYAERYFICSKPLLPVCGADKRCRYVYRYQIV